MKLTTPRFGELTFTDDQMVSFAGGLCTMPPGRHFVLLDDPASTPFQWLGCVEQPEYALSVLDPAIVLNEASRPNVPEEATATFVVATPGTGGIAWWLDLRHPILISAKERKGEQVTLDDMSLPEKFPVTLEQQPYETAE
jgi:flagellar assembly factor FliW